MFQQIGEVITGSQLPERVLRGNDWCYLFFDADLRSSAALLSEVQSIFETMVPKAGSVSIRSASDLRLLGAFRSGCAWGAEISPISRELDASSDPYGLLIHSSDLKLIAVQHIPAELGLLALEKAGSCEDMFAGFENLIQCNDLLGQAGEVISQLNGPDFLRTLVSNYCL